MTNILARHYTSFRSKKSLNPQRIFVACVLTCFLFASGLGYAGELTGKNHPDKTEKQVQAQGSKAPSNRSGQATPAEKKSWKGVISKSKIVANSDRAAPEVGFGEKTEAEIQRETPRKARIGVLGAMSGQLKQFGVAASNGAELASDELNAKGGIRGKEFELLVYDTKGEIAGARLGVETLLKHGVIAIVGAATGEVSFSATKILNDNQLIMVSAGSRRRLGDTGPYDFRNSLSDPDAIKSLVDYISKNRKWKNVALFSSLLNDYSIQLNAIFKSKLMARHYNITHELYLWSEAMSNIGKDEQTIAGQVKKLLKNPPDVVVFTGSGKEAVKVVNEMWKRGLKIPLMGAEDMNIPEFSALGEKAAGALIYSAFNIDSKNAKTAAFVKAYKRKFDAPPTRLAALSYDTYKLIAQAIENAKSMRPSHVRKALLAVKGFHGVTGLTSIGPTGEAEKKAFIFEMKKQNGKYKFVSIQEGY